MFDKSKKVIIIISVKKILENTLYVWYNIKSRLH